MSSKNLPERAQRFVPHRAPVLMLRELTVCDGESAGGTAWIPKSSPYQTMGMLSRTFFVELLAQLIAAAQGYREDEAQTTPSRGYLVGVRQFDCCGDAYGGDSLNLYIRRTNQVEGLNISEGKITRAEELLAIGELRCILVASTLRPSLAAVDSGETEANSFGDVISRSMEIVFLDAAAGRAEADVCFAPKAPVFAGHFPDRPVVPGFVWLETGLILAKTLLSEKVTLRKILSARFKKSLGPDEIARIELDVKSHTKEVFVISRIISQKTLAATFELSMEYI